jgi:hypothetical protein
MAHSAPSAAPRDAIWASHLHHAGRAVYGWLDGIP